jgi:hypothetical protein
MQEFIGTAVMMTSMQLLEKRGGSLHADDLIIWASLKALYSAFIIVVLILGLGGPTGWCFLTFCAAHEHVMGLASTFCGKRWLKPVCATMWFCGAILTLHPRTCPVWSMQTLMQTGLQDQLLV